MDDIGDAGKVANTVDDFADVSKAVTGTEQLIRKELIKHGMSWDDFQNLKLKDPDLLTPDEIKVMKEIRNSIPPVTETTPLQKTIPLSDVDNYASGKYTEVQGYIAKTEDVASLSNYDDMIEGLRLDYDIDGFRPFPDDGEGYGVIKFKTEAVDKIDIPYGTQYGGTIRDGYPFTQNGFTAGRNGTAIPEYKLSGRIAPNDGAELYKVINGKEILVATYIEQEGKFVAIN